MKRRDAMRDALDAALEFTVAGSFSRVGPAIRRRLFDWEAIDGESVRGQVAVVTGATSGLGLECATTLARLGARVIVLVRNAELGSRLCEQITAATGNPDVEVVTADLGDLESVRRAAQELRRLPAIHALVRWQIQSSVCAALVGKSQKYLSDRRRSFTADSNTFYRCP